LRERARVRGERLYILALLVPHPAFSLMEKGSAEDKYYSGNDLT